VVPFARNERSSLFRLIVDVDKKKFFLALTAGFHLCLRFQRKKERKRVLKCLAAAFLSRFCNWVLFVSAT
jgi:hypothetical protein